MIAEAGQDVLAGQYMNFIVASAFLFGLILSINLLADRVQDLLDPRFSTLLRRPELSSKMA